MRVLLMILVFGVGLAFGSGCVADTHSITGEVTAGGMGVRGARVRAYRGSDGYFRTALTNSFGRYVLPVEDCGTFSVTATARGLVFDPAFLTLPRDEYVAGGEIDFFAL